MKPHHSDFKNAFEYAQYYAIANRGTIFGKGLPDPKPNGSVIQIGTFDKWTTKMYPDLAYRSIQPNEVVFDIENQEEHTKLDKELKQQGYNFSTWYTGRHGTHTHLFFNKTLSPLERLAFMKTIGDKIGISFDKTSKGSREDKTERQIALELGPHRVTKKLKSLLVDNNGFEINQFPDISIEEPKKTGIPGIIKRTLPKKLCLGLEYAMSRPLPPGSRNQNVVPNFVAATRNHPQKDELWKTYCETQDTPRRELEGWDRPDLEYNGKQLHDTFSGMGLEGIVKECPCANNGLPSFENNKELQQWAKEKLMGEYHVVTIQDTGEMWAWSPEREMYVPGEQLLGMAIEDLLGEHNTVSVQKNILMKIQNSTYRDRDELKENIRNLIPLENGLYDIEKAELIPPSPEYFITTRIPITYNQEARAEKIHSFIQKISNGDQEMENELHKVLSLPLLKHHTFKGFYMLAGKPDAGKTTFLNLQYALYGKDNSTQHEITKLMDRDDYKFQLIDKYLNVQADIPNTKLRKLHVSYMKTLTGGDVLAVRQLYRAPISMRNTCKMVWGCNELPEVEGGDPAFWERANTICFYHSIPENERVPDYWEQLVGKEEKSGYLNTMIAMAREIKANRMRTNNRTAEEKQARWASMTPNVDRFFNECVTITSGGYIAKEDFYDYYKAWCNIEGIRPVDTEPFFRDYFWKSFRGEVKEYRPTVIDKDGEETKARRHLKGIVIDHDKQKELDDEMKKWAK